jgi:signal transduction histidine kinase
MPLLLVALLALLLLGMLQFAWIEQLSAGTRERMQASVSTGAARISEEFDREVARTYLALQIDAATVRERRWSNYQERYAAWIRTAPYPYLVQAIYLAEIGRNGTINLYAYEPATGLFTPRTWTTEFGGVLRSLDTTFRTRRVEGELIVGNSPLPIAEELPALIIPAARPWLLSEPTNAASELIEADVMLGGGVFARSRRPCLNCSGDGPLFAYTIVRFDRQAIEQRFIPTLATRHLGGVVDDYHLTIISRSNPQMLIFQSHAAAVDAKADAIANLLTIRLDEFNRLLGESASTDRRFRIAIGVVQGNDPTEAEPAEHGWQLRLTHRAGSLEAAVMALRMRNLMISGAALLLLGAALALMVVSVRRAQRVAHQKVEFVAAISHELRTPLSVICSAGANLADGLVSDAERTRQYGTLVAREGHRLAEMVEQVLAFTGAQDERAKPERHICDLRMVVERALASHRSAIEEYEFSLDLQIEPDLPVVLIDSEAIQRAISNLIGNALKYARDGHWLGVYVRSERHGKRHEILISVADRGPGISAAEKEQIFQPFYRGRRAIDDQIHGSGLGLSIVRMALEAHGGRVVVNDHPEQGCVFTLYLPVLAAQAQPSQPPEPRLGSEAQGSRKV